MTTVIAEHRRVSLSAFVPAELKRSLEEAARANERSVSAELRVALHEHLAGEVSIAQAVESAAR